MERTHEDTEKETPTVKPEDGKPSDTKDAPDPPQPPEPSPDRVVEKPDEHRQ